MKRKMVIGMFVFTISLLILISNLLPVIGPSLVAYFSGRDERRNKIYRIRMGHFLLALTISEIVFFAISAFVIGTAVTFYRPEVFWHLLLIGFSSNYLFSVAFYLLGVWKMRLKIKK